MNFLLSFGDPIPPRLIDDGSQYEDDASRNSGENKDNRKTLNDLAAHLQRIIPSPVVVRPANEKSRVMDDLGMLGQELSKPGIQLQVVLIIQ